jgi:hypothetical protein
VRFLGRAALALASVLSFLSLQLATGDTASADAQWSGTLTQAEDAPTVGSGGSLSGGRWYSYYDGVSQTAASALDIDHVVPLAEAWDS